jgi:hypothetical protein
MPSRCILKGGKIEQLGTPNNSLNRSAHSIAFIENLNLSVLCARPVNSGVGPLRITNQSR